MLFEAGSSSILHLDPVSIKSVDTTDSLQLYTLWSVFSKCSSSMEDGQRLENLTWRLWNREALLCSRTSLVNEYSSHPNSPANSFLSYSDSSFRSLPSPATPGPTFSPSVTLKSHVTLSINIANSVHSGRRHPSANLQNPANLLHESENDPDTANDKLESFKLNLLPLPFISSRIRQKSDAFLKSVGKSSSKSNLTRQHSSSPSRNLFHTDLFNETNVTKPPLPSLHTTITTQNCQQSSKLPNGPRVSLPCGSGPLQLTSHHPTVRDRLMMGELSSSTKLSKSSGQSCFSTHTDSSCGLSQLKSKSVIGKPKRRAVFFLSETPDNVNRATSVHSSVKYVKSPTVETERLKDLHCTKGVTTRNQSETVVGFALKSDDDNDKDDDEWEDADDWEDDEYRVSKVGLFNRINSRPALTSRPSLLTALMNESERACAFQSLAIQQAPECKTAPNRERKVSGGIKDKKMGCDRAVRRQVTSKLDYLYVPVRAHHRSRAGPRCTDKTKTLGRAARNIRRVPPQVAMSPQTTWNTMISSELSQSLREQLYWEKHGHAISCRSEEAFSPTRMASQICDKSLRKRTKSYMTNVVDKASVNEVWHDISETSGSRGGMPSSGDCRLEGQDELEQLEQSSTLSSKTGTSLQVEAVPVAKTTLMNVGVNSNAVDGPLHSNSITWKGMDMLGQVIRRWNWSRWWKVPLLFRREFDSTESRTISTIRSKQSSSFSASPSAPMPILSRKLLKYTQDDDRGDEEEFENVFTKDFHRRIW